MLVLMKNSLVLVSLSIASLAHLLCCGLPLLTLMLGTVGLGIMYEWLMPLQPYVIFLQLGVLAYAGHKAYFSAHAGHRTELAVFWLSMVFTIGSFTFVQVQHQRADNAAPTSFGAKTFQKIREVE
jgi:hypothetical protein